MAVVRYLHENRLHKGVELIGCFLDYVCDFEEQYEAFHQSSLFGVNKNKFEKMEDALCKLKNELCSVFYELKDEVEGFAGDKVRN